MCSTCQKILQNMQKQVCKIKLYILDLLTINQTYSLPRYFWTVLKKHTFNAYKSVPQTYYSRKNKIYYSKNSDTVQGFIYYFVMNCTKQ